MTYTEYRNAAEARSEEYYLRWKMHQCCPNCEDDRLSIRLMPATKLNKERWKFQCKGCKCHWYGPDMIKYTG